MNRTTIDTTKPARRWHGSRDPRVPCYDYLRASSQLPLLCLNNVAGRPGCFYSMASTVVK